MLKRVFEEFTTLGFMNTEVDNNIGCFDIGLCSEFRGAGYGKRLLETAIDTLKKANVDSVTLTVIERNSIAFDMYLKRGFVIESVLGHWMVIRE